MGMEPREAGLSPNEVCFGRFSFRHDELVLRRDGERVALQHQPALVLSRLLREAGVLVSHDALAAAVWGDGRHVEVGLNLRYCVRQVRRALDDDQARPVFVETVPRRGYKWIAPVRPSSPARSARVPRLPRRPLFRDAVIATTALCAGLMVGRGFPPPVPVPAPEVPRHAVSASVDAWEVIDALHILAHAFVQPGLERRAAEAARVLWRAAVGG